MTVLERPLSRTTDLRRMNAEQVADLAERLDGRPVPGLRWAEQQFLDWSLGRFDAEWVNGEVILMAPVSNEHDDLEIWLTTLLQMFIEAMGLGALRSDMFIRLPRRRRLRVPDLMFIAEKNRSRIQPTLISGPPDLIVEIVSHDSRNRDRRDKYLEYESGGVREYWLIDPLMQTLDVYVLRGRKYQPIDPKDGRVKSVVLPGFSLRSEWLFGARRPKVAALLKELGV